MKTNITCLLATAATAALFSCLPNQVHAADDPTNQLAAIYSKTDAAADRKDVDTCLSYHSPNFMQLDMSGNVLNTDQDRSRLQALFASLDTLAVTTHIDKCDYADKTATVIITEHIQATVASADHTKDMPVSGDVQARELWIKDGSGWKMDVAQTLTPGHLTPDE
jgi:hypothetical protein